VVKKIVGLFADFWPPEKKGILDQEMTASVDK
jgi:hypothetical protein